MPVVQLIRGDCLVELKKLADNSVHSIVTDPPYGLSFMGKKWDYDVPSVEVWAECLRVLKPGGHLLAFAGTRTQHRMAVRIEDAGFEIRDMIAWVYGSGFPKSLDVSKAIDKAGGTSTREQARLLRAKREAAGLTREQVAEHVGCTVSSVRDWEEGRARAVGAPIEFIVPSDEYRSKLADLLGYSADERRLIGAASDRRGDGTVYGVGHSGELRVGGNTDASRQWEGWGTALKPALEPITVARKPLVGTVAANVLEHGTGALNIDGCRVVGDCPECGHAWSHHQNTVACDAVVGRHPDSENFKGATIRCLCECSPPTEGRWPANLIHDGSDEVLAAFPDSNGSGPARRLKRGERHDGDGWGMSDAEGELRDAGTGSAARFFYCAKASRADRNLGLGDVGPQFQKGSTLRDAEILNASGDRKGNFHPTVKPTPLMRYLVRLITPPGGTVLDCFGGSGSTGVAAILEGFDCIVIERDEDENGEPLGYMDLIRARTDAAMRMSEEAANDAAIDLAQQDLFGDAA